MALQVWLPLNGNANNQGLSGDATINGTFSYASGGKIADKYLNISNMINIYVPNIKGNKICTFSFWAYVVSSTITSNWTLVARIDDQGTNAGSNMRFEICPKSNYNGIYCFSNHNNGNYGLTNGCITSPTGGYYDQWVHFCFTSDGTTFTRYMNGIKIGTCVYNGQATFNGNFQLANNNKCYKQDVRIYDHCLSAKEVKELAKGLVLHYRLAGPGQANLMPNTSNKIQSANVTTNYNILYSISGSQMEKGAKYVYSGYFENTGTKIIKLRIQWYNSESDRGGTTSSININPGDKGFYYLPFTYTSGTYNTFQLGMDGNSNTAITSSIYNYAFVKLERGSIQTSWCPNPADSLYSALGYNNNIEYDCSGYRRNGIKSGTITWDIDSPRYTTSYKLTTANIMGPIPNTLKPTESITMAIWVKLSSERTSGELQLFNNFEGGGAGLNISGTSYGMEIYSGGYKAAQVDMTGKMTQWHHFAGTFDGNNIKTYIDGELKATVAVTAGSTISYQATTPWSIGINPGPNGGSGGMSGNVSDARIYATALSADEIKQLYNAPISVDKSGNLYACEFTEV